MNTPRIVALLEVTLSRQLLFVVDWGKEID